MSTAHGPYVGLDHFAEEDAELFFGRDAERRQIIGNLQASRLTLLYAESGVGKSSLLRAGVTPRIRELAARRAAEGVSARYVPVVFSSWQSDPLGGLVAALEDALRPLVQVENGAELVLSRDGLERALEDVTATTELTPLLILDQFEDHFLYDAADEAFDADLARCVTRGDLQGHVLICLREDAYPQLGPRFKARIADVYGNYLHLDFLGEKAARDAIVRPLAAFNRRQAGERSRVDCEPALVDEVLEQVSRGRVGIGADGPPGPAPAGPPRIEPAYLQLVMKRLWDEEMATRSQCLRLSTLRRLGGADAIVHGHLDDVMARMPAAERDAAAAAFRFLVTTGGRKIALSSAELHEFSGADEPPLRAALKRLERERILRPIAAPEPEAPARHELYHDVLAPAIREWRERHVEERARRMEVRGRRLAAVVIALTAVVVGFVLYLWNPEPVQRLELATVDARFSLRGDRSPDSRLILVAVDDRTLARLDPDGSGRIPRADYARLLDRVRPDRPAAIGLDVLFVNARDPEGDGRLLRAIGAAHDRLVLPYQAFDVIDGPDGKPVIRADLLGRPDAVRRTGVATGFAGLPLDVDDTTRRADYQVDMGPSPLPYDASAKDTEDPTLSAFTFAFRVADLVVDASLRDDVAQLPAARRRASGEQSRRTTWIDFRGPRETVRQVSALDVLDGRVTTGAFRDKIVVIGVTGRRSPDVHATPFAAMSGAEVQANAVSTIVDGQPLRDTPAVDLVAILGLGALLAAAISRLSSRIVAPAILGAALVFAAGTYLAFQAGWVLAVVVPLATLAVAALGVTLLAGWGALRRRHAASA